MQSDGEAKTPGGATPLRVALVTDAGGLGDKAFNDAAYAGLLQAKAKLGAEIAVLQSKSAADYQSNITVLADQDYDATFAIGAPMRNDLAAIARNYPRRRFAIVDAFVDLPNVTSIAFREQDGSFLAGALAAMMTKSKTIGFLGGAGPAPTRNVARGFAAGARMIDPHVAVVDRYIGSSEDVATAKKAAGAMYDGGADILYVAAGKAGIGALDELRSRPHVFAIGAGSDQDALAPGKILTSVVKRVDVAVLRVAQEAQSLKLPSGSVEFGLKDGGIGLTDFRYTRTIVGPARLARLRSIRAALVAGRIVPPQTRAQLAAFRGAPL
ncbi:MAG: BMP family protein [Vulcanimicrobiaceae bacterium]